MIIVYKEPNKNNKLEFTKEEVEGLLEKAYQEGYKHGFDNGKQNANITTTPYWANPMISTTGTTPNPNTYTTIYSAEHKE